MSLGSRHSLSGPSLPAPLLPVTSSHSKHPQVLREQRGSLGGIGHGTTTTTTSQMHHVQQPGMWAMPHMKHIGGPASQSTPAEQTKKTKVWKKVYLYTSQKKKRNSWCQLTHCNLHCRLSFVSIGLLYGRRHLKFIACRRFWTVWSLIPSWCKPGLFCRLTRVLPANCGCVDIELRARAAMPASSIPTARPRSTTESRGIIVGTESIKQTWVSCTLLNWLPNSRRNFKTKSLYIALFAISLKSGKCQLLEISEVWPTWWRPMRKIETWLYHLLTLWFSELIIEKNTAKIRVLRFFFWLVYNI